MGSWVIWIGLLAVLALIGWRRYDGQRKRKRRETLRRSEDGYWVWIDFDGEEKHSHVHPDAQGGAWYSESSSSASGSDGSSGSDGGGDGGGGGD